MNHGWKFFEPLAYNFKTEKYDSVRYSELSAEQLEAYIPQDGIGVSLYRLHLKIGDTPVNALLKTLEAYAKTFLDRDGEQ